MGMTTQTVLRVRGDYAPLGECLARMNPRGLFVVCDSAYPYLPVRPWLEEWAARTGTALTLFSDFRPNPAYESAVEGVRRFRESGASVILAAGGGSALDVAKCIRLWCAMPEEGCWLDRPPVPSGVPLIALPTTAGTGSEATRYAVVYRGGEKQSVTSDLCLPQVVVMDPAALLTLPLSQKKATLMDALCHAVESAWSLNSTEESRAYSREAIRGVLAHLEGYLRNVPEDCAGMLEAANLAGKAINITQTTAGHAMCYKLTTLYGLPHGHAAALCNRALFPWLAAHPERWTDPRGQDHLREALEDIARAMGCTGPLAAAEAFARLTEQLALSVPEAGEGDIERLTASVNPVRLKNFPAALTAEDIAGLYRSILRCPDRPEPRG